MIEIVGSGKKLGMLIFGEFLIVLSSQIKLSKKVDMNLKREVMK